MIRFSEYVSIGHPDKIADYISQYLLDRYIEQDPRTKFAVEVQIKDNTVNIGGEVTSEVCFSDSDITEFVCEAVNTIGYDSKYADIWGRDNVVCGDSLQVTSLIRRQSPDIARGLSGWGDQGIFFGMATPNAATEYMPLDHTLAKRLCHELFFSGIGGLDIKTQIVVDDDEVKKVIVAIPLLHDERMAEVEKLVRATIAGDYQLIINGTGRYVQHSTIADCGTTGRKLVVDFYGGNCRIGGGSPWTKDGSKADLTLNLLAREIAKDYAQKHGITVYVSLACCIGSQEVDMLIQDSNNYTLYAGSSSQNPHELIRRYKLDTPIYTSMCKWGLFGEYQKDKIWEL